MKRLLEATDNGKNLDKANRFFVRKHIKVEALNREKANHRKPGDIAFYVQRSASISNRGRLKNYSLNQIIEVKLVKHRANVGWPNWFVTSKTGKKIPDCDCSEDLYTFDTREEALLYIVERQIYWLTHIISNSVEPKAWGSKALWKKALDYSLEKIQKNYDKCPEVYDGVIEELLKNI